MRNYNILAVSMLLGLILSATACTQESQYSLVSWNIRYNNPGDGPNAWPNRKDLVANQIKREEPSVICLQEVLKGQLEDLTNSLPDYSWSGVGRDDGQKKGEFVPILFKKDQFNLIKTDHFWLSEKPTEPGIKGWDAVCPRMVTWVCLQDKKCKDTLYIFNTHFDHVGIEARRLSAKLIATYTDSIAGESPVIVAGDLNSIPSDQAYLTMIESSFLDSRLISHDPPTGPEYTFTGFDSTQPPGDRIDYIFVKNLTKVISYQVFNDKTGQFYHSDHLMVKIRF
ncbi:MAG: endonuclease/exonuclease/phosphatase family protein [Bacteroidales bacterium]|jgi:endonuclease/exonuclease/phosphatase family metal-dependent hydrolase|nr:endonuclease/exonuclease/phosphatase family protein [Bacteroidales bacterium]MDD2571391.1 endonuclease/exonuclease/phosphatase family protein [Bacteroidales bacterium]MDD2813330.1 endonuclease/exonuclease/phosphatase family protein [Bacteroidales bacterium]MDD3385870.1 endonuclease/exonuclease/phosphatase family protein [Bacteroidales bacterium]MDD3811769.1 endonuclease/exonuclease/phosphatase family protein [Bacteroidales bacterium]